MEAMKSFPPTRHRTEKSGSKQPELRRIRPGRRTTTRHQVLTTASQSSLPACPSQAAPGQQPGRPSPGRSHTATASQASHAASRIEHRPQRSSFTHHRPPGIALCRTSPGSQTAAAGLTPPTTDGDRSSEASCRTSIEPCTARRSPPPSHPSQPVALLPRQILLGVATDCRWAVSLDASCRG